MATKGAIMVVDNNAADRESLLGILRTNYDVIAVTNGPEALEVIKGTIIDLVTIDLRLPGLSDIEVIKKIKKIQPDIEIIVITGYGTLGNVQEAIRSGASDFISKPFNTYDILSIISKTFERRTYNLKIKALIQQIKGLRASLNKSNKVDPVWGDEKA